MQAVTIDQKTFAFPESWNECTPMQAAVLTDLLLNHELTEVDFYLSLGLNWASLTDKLIRRRYFSLKEMAEFEKNRMQTFAYQDAFLNFMSECYVSGKRCEWALQEPRLTRQIYPVLMDGKYLSVKDGLTDMAYIEYVAAENAMKAYHAAKEDKAAQDKALTDLLCALYAPKGKKGARKRIPDDDVDAKRQREEDLAKVPTSTKKINLLFFESCMVAITEQFPRIFNGSSESHGGESEKFGPVGLIIEVAGEKFGTIDQTAEANLYVMLTHLEKEAIKYDEFKQKYGK